MSVVVVGAGAGAGAGCCVCHRVVMLAVLCYGVSRGTPGEWLITMLGAFNKGDIAAFEKVSAGLKPTMFVHC